MASTVGVSVAGGRTGRSIAQAFAGLDALVFIAPHFDAQEEAYAANALAAARAQGGERFISYSVLKNVTNISLEKLYEKNCRYCS